MYLLNKLFYGINQLAKNLIVIALFIIGIIMSFQLIARYIFNYSFVWAEEISLFLLTWICFIGAGYGISIGAHIRMTAFIDILPKYLQKYINILFNLILISMFVYLFPYSIRYYVMQKGAITPGMQISLGYVFVIVPIGIIYLIIALLIDTFKEFKEEK